jgi:hypothetical protein
VIDALIFFLVWLFSTAAMTGAVLLLGYLMGDVNVHHIGRQVWGRNWEDR